MSKFLVRYKKNSALFMLRHHSFKSKIIQKLKAFLYTLTLLFYSFFAYELTSTAKKLTLLLQHFSS
jgi:hypothetical protein